MSKSAVYLRVALVSICLTSCSDEAKSVPPPPPPPPPLPTAPLVPAVPAEPAAEGDADQQGTPEAKSPDTDDRADEKPGATAARGEPERDDTGAEKPAKSGASLYDLVKEGKATLPGTKPTKPVVVQKPGTETTKPVPRPPEPPKPVTPPAPPKPVGKVTIPSTANVRVDVPKGLQDLLNLDTRMGPFAKQVVDVADRCYAAERKKNANAEGTISVAVTMHENERPDANVKPPPSALNGVVSCAMLKLMNLKMPLFTGPEGQKHTVKIVFTK